MRSEILLDAGLLGELSWLDLLPPASGASRHFLVTDTTVNALYGEQFAARLVSAGLTVRPLVIPAGERSKSLETFERLVESALQHGLDRWSFVFGLGGGVVNNVAGFLASTLHRGIGLVQLPTTLLAQIDAAVDFKHAVNGSTAKNQVGSYYPATLIVVDPDALATLATRQHSNGIAEAIKHALAEDDGLFRFLGEGSHTSFSDPAFRYDLLKRVITLKVQALNGTRSAEHAEMVTQYGHAVGHALEQLSDYTLLHGEAIALGMMVMAQLAVLIGAGNEHVVDSHREMLSRYGLPTAVPPRFSASDLLAILRRDKHYYGQMLRAGVVTRIGELLCIDGDPASAISDDVLALAIARCYGRGYESRPR